jgi:hypothetical protein
MTQLSSVQRCHWHRCPTEIVEYLRKLAEFEKALSRVSVAKGKLFGEKLRGEKSRVREPLINSTRGTSVKLNNVIDITDYLPILKIHLKKIVAAIS